VTPARTPMECLKHAQTMMASAGLTGGDGCYLGITRERRHAEGPLRERIAALR